MDENNNNEENTSDLTIGESIRTSNEAIDELLKTNELQKFLDRIETFSHISPYHSMSKAMALFGIAVFSLDKGDLERAENSVEELSKLSNKLRKSGFIVNVIKIVKTPNYQKYTDMEAHCELIHCISVVMSAGVGALNTHNIYGLIKVVYRLQKFIKTFDSARTIQYKKSTWENNESQRHYEAGIRLINGFCNLFISKLPPKILKIINFFGYNGVGSTGFKNLNKSAFELPGIFSNISRAGLLGCWSYAEAHGSLSADNLPIFNQVLAKELEKYPESILFRALAAKEQQITGRIDKAIDSYLELINCSDPLISRVFQFEVMLCFALKCQWDECIKYAELLKEKTTHSPSCTHYLEAVFRYAKSIDENDSDMKQMASELFRIVPTLRIRHLGKTVTPEKVAVVNSEKYFKCDESLILPEMDILYHSNMLSFLRSDPILLNRLMDRVIKQYYVLKKELNSSDILDNYLTTIFFKGVILKFLGQHSEAKSCFNTVLEEESRVGRDSSLLAQAKLELGLIEIELDNRDEAQALLQECIDKYSGYLNENFVHIKAFAGLRLLGITNDMQKEDEFEKKELTKEWLKSMNVKKDKYKELLIEDDQSIVL